MGKWVIALGEHVFGATPFGWRIAVALLGIATILVTGRAARRLTRSNVIGTVAALLMALDGLNIAMSRTALLDTTLTFFVMCAFAFLLLDKDRANNDHIRWFRVAMGAMLGMAVATKWSGLYFAVGFGLLMLSWDFGRRLAEHQFTRTRDGVRAWIVRDALPALLIPIEMIGIYLVSWSGWFLTKGGWDREWGMPTENPILRALRGLWHYHADMLRFHTSLHAQHNYRANPLGWPLMIRPTSFFYETPDTCGAKSCSQEVIPLGNPIIWWLGAFALLWLVVMVINRRTFDGLPIVVGFAAGWVPWLYYYERTTFTFYGVVFLPFTAIALAKMTYALSHGTARSRRRDTWTPAVVVLVAGVAALTTFFYPILTGIPLSYSQWHLRMWLPTWI